MIESWRNLNLALICEVSPDTGKDNLMLCLRGCVIDCEEQPKGQFNWMELWQRQVTITTPSPQIGEGFRGFKTQTVIALIRLWPSWHWLWQLLLIPTLIPGNLLILGCPLGRAQKRPPMDTEQKKMESLGGGGRQRGRTGKEKTKMSSRFCLKQTAERYILPKTVECLKTSVVSALMLRMDKQNTWKVHLMDVKFVISMVLPSSHTTCLWVRSTAGKFSHSLLRPDKTEHKPLTWRPERARSKKLTLRREIAIPAEDVYC